MKRAIYLDGEPANLEAAAVDALDWLRLFGAGYGAEIDKVNMARLGHAIAAIEKFLPSKPPVFRETEFVDGYQAVMQPYPATEVMAQLEIDKLSHLAQLELERQSRERTPEEIKHDELVRGFMKDAFGPNALVEL